MHACMHACVCLPDVQRRGPRVLARVLGCVWYLVTYVDMQACVYVESCRACDKAVCRLACIIAQGDWTVVHVAQTHAAPASSSQAVHPGDVLVLIEEWEIKGASPGQVRELLDGTIGSKVLLTVTQKSGQTRHVELTRGMRPRKQPPSEHQHTLTPRGLKHENVALDDGGAAYAAESYGQSSNLRHNYEEPAAENPGAARGARAPARATEAGKPRELVTSLELKGTMQHAAALYQQSQASHAGAGAEGARGGGGGVVEEALVSVKGPFASSPSRASMAPSERFGPVSSSGSTMMGLSDRFAPVSSAVGTHFGVQSLTPSVAPSDRFGPVSSSASAAALRSASPSTLLPGPKTPTATRNPALSPRPPLSPRGTSGMRKQRKRPCPVCII